MKLRALAPCVALGTLAVTRNASAQADAETLLTWDAPDGCPSSADVEARIRARTPNPPRSVSVRITPVPDAKGEVQVSLTTDGADRTFTAPSCDEAATAVAVIVALAASRAESPKTEPTPAPTIVPPAPPAEKPQPPPPPTPKWRAVVGGGGAVDTGSLPTASPGVLLGAEIHAPSTWIAGLDVAAFLPSTEARAPAETSVALVDALLRGCAMLPIERALRAGTCLGAGIGFLPASSSGITQPRSAIGLRPEAIASLRLEAPLSASTALRFEGGLLADFVRAPFQIATLGDVYRPPFLTFRGAVALDFRFR